MTSWAGAAASTCALVTALANPLAKLAGVATSSLGLVTSATANEAISLSQTQQQFNVGTLITLFTIDATSIGGSLYRFCPMSESSAIVVWQGNDYPPIACQSEDWEINGQGKLPTPKLRVSNVGGLFGSFVIALQDLVGSTVTRYRTFQKFLDGQEFADPTVFFEPDIYIIQRKTAHTKEMVEWELSSPLDQENVYLPSRVVLKYNCTQIYRIWDPVALAFNYANVTCPFNGSQNGNKSYDENGNLTTDPNDVCGRLDSDCALRFPGQPLPTWAFPGVGGTGTGG